MNAVLIGKVKDKYNAYRTDLVYEYRGKTYVITAYDNGYSESLRDQHKREQARIDRELSENQRQNALQELIAKRRLAREA